MNPDVPPRRDSYAADFTHPEYHFTAPTGWMNDPNGLSQWDGTFHLFYQFNPHEPLHRAIRWGHATSSDMLSWADEPIALSPEAGGPDSEGCWSGVLVDDEGTPTIVYSAHDGDRQLPSLAFGDATLTKWTKHSGNPVIAGPPPGLAVTAFRDHCVWREGDLWMQLVGSGIEGIGGAALLYESPDLREWTYRGPILVGDINLAEPVWTGSMWECVDLFELDGHHVLIVSVWDEGTTHFSAYFKGSYSAGVFQPTAVDYLDYGLRHFYAPQSFRDDAGRRIILGWMQEGREDDLTMRSGWSGCLTVPRVLSWGVDGRLNQQPIPELEQLRHDRWEAEPGLLFEGTAMQLGSSDSAAVDIELLVSATSDAVLELDVLASAEGNERTTIAIDWEASTVSIDRERSSLEAADTTPLSGPIHIVDGLVALRVLVDHSVIEVFANGTALSTRVYPTRSDSTGAQIRALGTVIDVQRATSWQLMTASTDPLGGDRLTPVEDVAMNIDAGVEGEPSSAMMEYSARRVLVIGEAIMDIIDSGDHHEEHVGGSPTNVALGLGLLGVRTSLLTRIGMDERGKAISTLLDRAGVEVLKQSVGHGLTSTAVASLDDDGVASYEFDIEWNLPASTPLPPTDIIHTGSIATFLEPGAGQLRALLANNRGAAVVSYDPNIRPGVIGDKATARDAFAKTAALADLVKLSHEDSEWLFPDEPIDGVLRRILGMGPRLAIMTCGGAGSMLMTHDLELRVPAIPVKVVDTIGAGDTYMASIIAGLLTLDLDRLTLNDLEQLGARASAAAITVVRHGAQLPTLEDIDRFLNKELRNSSGSEGRGSEDRVVGATQISASTTDRHPSR